MGLYSVLGFLEGAPCACRTWFTPGGDKMTKLLADDITNPLKKTETEGALKSPSAKPYSHFYILRQRRSMLSSLAERIFRSYRDSLLRLVLRGLSSCYHRIQFERSIRGTPRFDAVRRCVVLPQLEMEKAFVR
jgi:hypothetical protein